MAGGLLAERIGSPEMHGWMAYSTVRNKHSGPKIVGVRA